jgi:iron complex transport system ATP-binding protein
MHTGETWSILGPNGSGKTSLLETLAGLRKAASGEIRINGQPISSYAPKRLACIRSVLFQNTEDNFPATVLETTLTGRHPHINYLNAETREDILLAEKALAAVDLEGFANRDVLTLSGGERQRVAIATCLAQDTPIRLFDEPANHLDLRHQSSVLKLIDNQEYLNFVVLHDINHAWRYTSHALLLYDDGTVESGRVEELLHADRLASLYGCEIRCSGAADDRFYLSA